MLKKHIFSSFVVILLSQSFVGCSASSSHFYNTWSLYKGITKNEAGELVSATVLDMMVGTGLLEVDPYSPDWKKIYRRIQGVLDHEDRYNFCSNGYKIVPSSAGFERHGTYVMLSVVCR
ncbi:MAG: hypothetical protein Q9M18_01700 [Mariprofundaceae bacterium]|nr:hypothetical protein [Mariprofundaceae bacterium]